MYSFPLINLQIVTIIRIFQSSLTVTNNMTNELELLPFTPNIILGQ